MISVSTKGKQILAKMRQIMARRLGVVFSILLLVSGGCLNNGSKTSLVSSSPLGDPAASGSIARTSVKPGSTESAARADLLGRKILAANPQIGMKPMFLVIGSPEPEIFHKRTGELFITEGLVKQCKTEGELAALLCHELGKMVSERETLAGPQARTPQRQPPLEVRAGNDGPGSSTPADQVRVAELAVYEQDLKRETAAALPPPNADFLARIYLQKAGFADSELQAATPLLQAAAANMTFEKQILGQQAGSWGN
jgi:hypothetical protein